MQPKASFISPIDPQIIYKFHGESDLSKESVLLDNKEDRFVIKVVKYLSKLQTEYIINNIKAKSTCFNNVLFHKYFYNPAVKHSETYDYEKIMHIGLNVKPYKFIHEIPKPNTDYDIFTVEINKDNNFEFVFMIKKLNLFIVGIYII